MVEREDLKSRQGQVHHVVSINPSEGARSHVLKVMFKRNQSRLLSGRAYGWGGVGGKSAVVGAATPASAIQDQ